MRAIVDAALFLLCILDLSSGFQGNNHLLWQRQRRRRPVLRSASSLSQSSDNNNGDGGGGGGSENNSKNDTNLADVLSGRLPTSVEDQVRQAADSLRRADSDGRRRHALRLLLPVIGATDLDDWPGGARQMMEAAYPLVKDILLALLRQRQQEGGDNNDTTTNGEIRISETLLDASDGVYALMAQAKNAKDDTCTILLPTADTIPQLQELSRQVGDQRNLLIVNPQWKRRSDFGGSLSAFLGGGGQNKNAAYVEETFEPTFSLTNLIVEGENIRVLRTYPGPWRVFLRKEEEDGQVDWEQVGQKEFVASKPSGWEKTPENQRDGGLMFSHGQPTYQEIMDMFSSAPNYTPKNPAERAMAAFNFIKDTL